MQVFGFPLPCSPKGRMSGRNRGPPHSIKGPPHEPPFGRGPLGPLPHPALLDEMRDAAAFARGGPPRPLPPHPALIEERLAIQHQEIQGLLIDNQRLAATHVALKQELAAVQHELQRAHHAAAALQGDADVQLRELYDKSAKMEVDIREAEAMRVELLQVRAEIQKLSTVRQELGAQVQVLTQDLSRAGADIQQVPVIQAEIESMKQELQRAR